MDTNWSADFQHLILAAALRGDLLREVPLDPELFRSRDKGPLLATQVVAEILVKFYASYNRAPSRVEFEKLVADAGKGQPERAEALADVVALIMTAVVPDDTTFLLDQIRPALDSRRMEKAMFEAAPLLDRDPERAREIMRQALEPTATRAAGTSTPVGLQTVGKVQRRLGSEPDWVVDRMFAAGDVSICVALPGTGKSYFISQLAVDVAMGTPFLGRKTKQGTVVLFLFDGAKKTTNLMTDLGLDDPYNNEDILVWTAEAEGATKNPLQWMLGALGDRRPSLIIIDTLADLIRLSGNSANGGYDEIIGKLGGLYSWAMNNGVHIHFAHHANKANRDEITGSLGSVGIVSKPGTILSYRKMNAEDEASPRVLKGVKHREGRSVADDLPATVLEIDRTTRRLFPSGTRVEVAKEISVRDIGAEMIRIVRAAMLQNPAGIRQDGDEGLLIATEGRKTVKLEALRTLTAPDGPLERTGTPRSKADPLMVRLRTPDAEREWRDKFTRRAAPLQDGEEA
jgi:hypothetical protein